MKVLEIFNSVEGEGIRAGELATFIRLFGCNLSCSFCDTAYSQSTLKCDMKIADMKIVDIVKECDKYTCNNITITGGEPLIHEDIILLIVKLLKAGYNVNVETNGSVNVISIRCEVQSMLHQFNEEKYIEGLFFTIDYKLSYSGMEDKMSQNMFKNLTDLSEKDIIKLVVSRYDLDNAILLIKQFQETFKGYIYLSPVFQKVRLYKIIEAMQKANLNEKVRFQLQLHKYIWDPDKRGV